MGEVGDGVCGEDKGCGGGCVTLFGSGGGETGEAHPATEERVFSGAAAFGPPALYVGTQ